MWQRLINDLRRRNNFSLTDEERMDPALNRLSWIIMGIIASLTIAFWIAENLR